MVKAIKAVLYIAFCIVLFSVFFSIVSAADVEITVQTDYPSQAVTLNVLNPTTFEAIRTFVNNSDSDGKLIVSFSSSLSEVSFSVIIRQGGRIVLGPKKFEGPYAARGTILLDTTKSASSSSSTSDTSTLSNQSSTSNTTNATSISTEQDINTSQQNTTNQTGSTNVGFRSGGVTNLFSNVSKGIRSAKYYIIGFIVIIGFVFLGVFMKRHFKRGQRLIELKQRIVKKEEKPVLRGNVDKELANAERKIREAQEEVERIKNKQQQLSEAEQRFEEARRDVERLRKGL